jgi:hypothetical protein
LFLPGSTVAGGGRRPAFRVDFGYTHIFLKDAEINEPIFGGVGGTLSGEYENSVDVFAVQATIRLRVAGQAMKKGLPCGPFPHCAACAILKFRSSDRHSGIAPSMTAAPA